MYQTCIYNYDSSLEQSLLLLIDDMWNTNQYFVSKGWEGGPHIQLVTKNKISQSEYKTLKKRVHQLIEERPLDKSYMDQVKKKYEQSSLLISNLENKKSERAIREHGEIDIHPYFLEFHNERLTNLYMNERFRHYQLLLDTRKYIEAQNIRLDELFPLIFSRISDIYHEKNNNKGYFSFVSHVHGFFELSAKQEKPYNENLFETLYVERQLGFEIAEKAHSQLINRWYKYFSEFYGCCLSQVDELLDDHYKAELARTIEELEKNFKNDFHRNFVAYSKKNNFMEKPEATAYRFTVNLLYLLLPYFNISALKKQKYIYMAYRVVESKKGMTWREELGLDYNSYSKSI
ncbi:hypothetical protein J2D69_17080 [Lysinibacillus sphaericus]|uniref:Thiopeptide-type bacteriocin biosynthesis domain-containing protein n=5 Tax=Bacillaceae TaxID=186817 RepID=B1HW47_LYSSC|nr:MULTISPECIES: hypothetical protein [Lysinibacillus]ACA41486.1 conserved hypothetical protein [Lysinibacillus sphaericus C3-41]MBE5082737.1 hypothetical protein [Bacillus thuringiensis]AMO32631.1 hypothetical protein AR327_09410 [Lysinibacillus sphaericus]AMR92268.1 hypothetical protein A1T07_19800 [Lysinibacillus sphaericus]ANA46317.1 hypothetical protein A2J09_12470 [Lysinibacillus sphaericus]